MPSDRQPETDGPSPAENRTCLGIGSNVNAPWHLRRAVARIAEFVVIDAVSTAWESPAVGAIGPDFLNAAILGRTPLTRESLRLAMKRIEDELGRLRTRSGHALVTIDIDLVFHGGETLEDDLWTEAYRAVPVAELMPELCSPSTGESLAQVAAILAARTTITPHPDVLVDALPTTVSRPHFSESIRNRTQ